MRTKSTKSFPRGLGRRQRGQLDGDGGPIWWEALADSGRADLMMFSDNSWVSSKLMETVTV